MNNESLDDLDDGFCFLDQIESRQIESLWLNALYFGTLAMLDGDPGIGKSHVTLDIAARVTTGRPFPDGAACTGPANVVILNGDDASEDVVRSRLERFDADMSRVIVQQSDPRSSVGWLTFPSGLNRLDAVLARTDARLVVIDPIIAFLDRNVNILSDQSVRRALMLMCRLSERRRCVIWLVRHLIKHWTGSALYRGSGSIGFQGACRSSWLLGRYPDKPGRRVLAQVTNRYAPLQSSLAFRFSPKSKDHPLTWIGPCRPRADDLLRTRSAAAISRPVIDTSRMLKSLLANGARTLTEIRSVARQHKIHLGRLRAAKQLLDISSIRVAEHGIEETYWTLPGQGLPPHIPASAIIWDPDQAIKPRSFHGTEEGSKAEKD